MYVKTLLIALVVAAVAGCATRNEPAPTAQMDIVDTAVAAGSFNTLVTAVQTAGLVENLLKPENKDQLVSILTYHVVAGETYAADLAGKQLQVATVQGETVDIDGTDGVTVDGASVIQADVGATNGVIHVIDEVILP